MHYHQHNPVLLKSARRSLLAGDPPSARITGLGHFQRLSGLTAEEEDAGDLRPWNSSPPQSSPSQSFGLGTFARVRLRLSEGWGHCYSSSSLQGKTHRVTSYIGNAKNHLEKAHTCHMATMKCESLKLLTTTKPWQCCFLPFARWWLNKRTKKKAFRGGIPLAKSDIYFCRLTMAHMMLV